MPPVSLRAQVLSGARITHPCKMPMVTQTNLLPEYLRNKVLKEFDVDAEISPGGATPPPGPPPSSPLRGYGVGKVSHPRGRTYPGVQNEKHESPEIANNLFLAN